MTFFCSLYAVPIGFARCVEHDKDAAQVWEDIIESIEPIGIAAGDLRFLPGVCDEGANVKKAVSDHMIEGKLVF